MSDEERRKNKRINLVIDVKYHMSTYQNWLTVKTRNLSAGGICLLTKYFIPVGSVLDFIFVLPETSKPIKVSGKIIWNEIYIDENYYINGVKFLSLKKSDKESIGKFVDNATFDMRK